jgi:hypothetical protein
VTLRHLVGAAVGARRAAALAGIVMVLAGLLAVTVHQAGVARLQAGRIVDLERRRGGLLAGDPAASEETTRRLRAVLDETARAADALDARLLGSVPQELLGADDEAVRERADAFFDLAWYTEEMRATAAAANVELAPREAFGFAVHAEGAPRNEDVARVHRQRERIERLLRLLFTAGPLRLDWIRRERPATDRLAVSGRAEESGAERDYFEPESHLLLRERGTLETLAFQVCFVATGAEVVRTLINGLLADERAWVVRWIEVKPIGDPASSAASAEGHTLAAPPLRVSLLVESVEGRVRSDLPEERS